MSPKHASSVPLVLNPFTGTITAQFHAVFDDWFATVSATPGQLPNFDSDDWAKVFGDSAYQYPLDDDDLAQLQAEASAHDRDASAAASRADSHRELPSDYVKPLPDAFSPLRSASSPQRESVSSGIPSVSGGIPTVEPLSSDLSTRVVESSVEREREPRQSNATPSVSPIVPDPVTTPTSVVAPVPASSTPTVSVRRSMRTRRAPQRLTPTALGHFVAAFDVIPSSFFSSIYNENGLSAPIDLFYEDVQVADVHGNSSQMAVYKASNSDPDTLSFEEAMNDADNNEWRKAALKEIQALEEKGTWREVDINDVLSSETILPGTWVFRRKRTPDGTIKKFKGRYCVRGDLQVGTFETFAPVIAFSTVRLFLILSLKFEWCTCSIDFSNAFVQAELKNPFGSIYLVDFTLNIPTRLVFN